MLFSLHATFTVHSKRLSKDPVISSTDAKPGLQHLPAQCPARRQLPIKPQRLDMHLHKERTPRTPDRELWTEKGETGQYCTH
jgi:hypothetical protein